MKMPLGVNGTAPNEFLGLASTAAVIYARLRMTVFHLHLFRARDNRHGDDDSQAG